MKKVFFLLFSGLLVLFLMFPGCGTAFTNSDFSSVESFSKPDSNVSTPSVDYSKNMILITSGGETISTYASILWDNSWTEEGLLCADFVSSTFMGVLDRLSVITYTDDFSIQYREDISFSSIRIFDENLTRLYNSVDLSYLNQLPEGAYYIVVVVVKQGNYISSVSQYEYSGYECAFKLAVNGN